MNAPCSGAICIIEMPPSRCVSSISALLDRVGRRAVARPDRSGSRARDGRTWGRRTSDPRRCGASERVYQRRIDSRVRGVFEAAPRCRRDFARRPDRRRVVVRPRLSGSRCSARAARRRGPGAMLVVPLASSTEITRTASRSSATPVMPDVVLCHDRAEAVRSELAQLRTRDCEDDHRLHVATRGRPGRAHRRARRRPRAASRSSLAARSPRPLAPRAARYARTSMRRSTPANRRHRTIVLRL